MNVVDQVTVQISVFHLEQYHTAFNMRHSSWSSMRTICVVLTLMFSINLPFSAVNKGYLNWPSIRATSAIECSLGTHFNSYYVDRFWRKLLVEQLVGPSHVVRGCCVKWFGSVRPPHVPPTSMSANDQPPPAAERMPANWNHEADEFGRASEQRWATLEIIHKVAYLGI